MPAPHLGDEHDIRSEVLSSRVQSLPSTLELDLMSSMQGGLESPAQRAHHRCRHRQPH